MDVTVLAVSENRIIARIATDEDFAKTFCNEFGRPLFNLDYIVVSKGDEIQWVVDGMTPGWYIPGSTQDVFDRYPELKGKF
jgi:hypothetical protein